MMESGCERTDRAGKGAVLAALLLAAVLATLFCSCYSPLFSIVGCHDQSCFCRAGMAWGNGMVPYVDFIDVKGPLLFLIHRVGYCLNPHGLYAMWAIETATVFLILYHLYRLARVFLCTRAQSTLASTLSLLFLCGENLYHEGGRAELYMAAALTYLLWQACLFMRGKADAAAVRRIARAIGISFAVSLLVKYNGVAPSLLLLGGISVHLWRGGRRAAFGSLVVRSSLVAALVVLPFVILLLAEGNLRDACRVYFLLNAETMKEHAPICLDLLKRMAHEALVLKESHAPLISLPFLYLLARQSFGKAKACILLLAGVGTYLSCLAGPSLYYLLYCAPLAIFPAAHITRRFSVPARAWALIPLCAAAALIAGRENGMRRDKCGQRVLAVQHLSPELQAMEDEVSSHPGSRIMFIGVLDVGFGITTGVLPACPEWMTLNGAPPSFLQRQADAVRRGLADYVVLKVPALETEGLLRSAGYRECGRPALLKGSDDKTIGLYKKQTPR